MPRTSNSLVGLPAEATDALAGLGLRLRARRLAQNMTVAQAAERLLCSPTTYRSLECGRATVSLGLLAHALWLFGLADDLDKLCPLEMGMIADKRGKRARAHRGIADDERDF